MIDLEKEYKAFEKTWLVLGASFKNFKRGNDNMYHLNGDIPNLTDDEKILTLNCINTALAMWLIQARAKQTEIDSLKSENAALKEKLGNMEDCWYWDGAEYYVTDPYQYDLNDLDNFEIITLEKYQTTPRVPEYFCKVFEDEDTCEIIAFPDYADAKKAIANNKRIFNEAQGDGDE